MFNNLEYGGTYQLRTNNFKPIDGYSQILNQFDQLYESYQNAATLFEVIEDNDSINIIADTFQINFNSESIDSYDVEQIKNLLIENSFSEEVITIIVEQIENQGYVEIASIIEKIALPNQTIHVQYTDTLYGNSEFDIFT